MITQNSTLTINSLLSAALIILLTATSCGGGKYAATEKIYKKKLKQLQTEVLAQPASQQIGAMPAPDKEWIASVNFGIRKPNYVMIHHTAQNSTEQTIRTFQLERTQVSAHYVIGRDGKIVQMVNDYLRAHHAGAGLWANSTDLNSSSIGIELDNNGTSDPWTENQMASLITLLQQLKSNYNIPQQNFIGHMDFAPVRKNDPSRFPWERLAKEGFGFWYDTTLPTVPDDFDIKVGLRVIGYDIKNLDAAIKGFKHHYIQENSNSATLSEKEKQILYNIYTKYLYL